MGKPRRKFDSTYKLQAVVASYSHRSSKVLAEELGIRPALIYRRRSGLSTDQEQFVLFYVATPN